MNKSEIAEKYAREIVAITSSSPYSYKVLAPIVERAIAESQAPQPGFEQWKQRYAPNDSGEDYDLVAAFRAGVLPDSSGHWPDRFKKPNHPTFSDESVYAVGPDAAKAGRWEGGKFNAPLPFTKSLTCVINDYMPAQQKQADDDLALLKSGEGVTLRLDIPEAYFHRLRLRAAEHPEILKDIAVFFMDAEGKYHEIDITEQTHWPPGFLNDLWDEETRILMVKQGKRYE